MSLENSNYFRFAGLASSTILNFYIALTWYDIKVDNSMINKLIRLFDNLTIIIYSVHDG